MIPRKLRAPTATPKRLPSQNLRSLTLGGASPSPGDAQRRPPMNIIISPSTRGLSPAPHPPPPPARGRRRDVGTALEIEQGDALEPVHGGDLLEPGGIDWSREK